MRNEEERVALESHQFSEKGSCDRRETQINGFLRGIRSSRYPDFAGSPRSWDTRHASCAGNESSPLDVRSSHARSSISARWIGVALSPLSATRLTDDYARWSDTTDYKYYLETIADISIRHVAGGIHTGIHRMHTGDPPLNPRFLSKNGVYFLIKFWWNFYRPIRRKTMVLWY